MKPSIAQIVTIYKQGIVCPGEAWNQILDASNGDDLPEILDLCEPTTQEMVRELYRDRPSSFPSGLPNLREWCERET